MYWKRREDRRLAKRGPNNMAVIIRPFKVVFWARTRSAEITMEIPNHSPSFSPAARDFIIALSYLDRTRLSTYIRLIINGQKSSTAIKRGRYVLSALPGFFEQEALAGVIRTGKGDRDAKR